MQLYCDYFLFARKKRLSLPKRKMFFFELEVSGVIRYESDDILNCNIIP